MGAAARVRDHSVDRDRHSRVPDAWADAAAQAKPGQLPPGAIAYTVEGIRHRDGVWNDTAETLSVPVTFTLFMACPHDGDPCYLLRISQLDNPLR